MIPFLVMLYMVIIIFCLINHILHPEDEVRALLFSFGRSFDLLFGHKEDKDDMSDFDWVVFFS